MTDKDEILRRLETLSHPRPLSLNELIHHFRVPSERRPAFRRLVRELAREGHLIRVGGNRYSLPGPLKLATGKIQIHPEGYGFLTPEGERGSDIHIPERFTGGAMDGDKVQVQVEGASRYRKSSGRVVRILERAHSSAVGVLESRGKSFILIPQNRRLGEIQILKKDSAGARRGLAAVAEITEYPEHGNLAQGRIIEVLGDPEDPDVEVEIVLRKHGIPGPFPERVLKEAASCPQKVRPEDVAGRQDLRDLVTFTIDGETARDFDDAVSIEKTSDGSYRLGVHIADVSHYVREGSLLDREARNRGTSVYFPDRAIPMLPEPLSAGICSLRPAEDRLVQSVFLDFDSKGNVLGTRFADAVIRSHQRFTYTIVAKLLEHSDRASEKRYAPLLPTVQLMGELARILRERRLARGSLDFDLPEADIILDTDGQVESILRQERNDAHKLIEEFMLAANQAVASYILRHGTRTPAGRAPGTRPSAGTHKVGAGLYRVHEPPDPLKMAGLAAFLETLGYSLPDAESVRPSDLRDVLERAQGKPEERLLNMLVLRSLRQARYGIENLGHFALHFEYYTHFTSPIRRYPDLVVHRILRRLRQGKRPAPGDAEAAVSNLAAVAEHSSWTERRADEAERDLVDLKKIQFMGKHLGSEFWGHISGVTRFGFFVELEDYFVEGLVPLVSLKDDYYVFDEVRHSLRGERTRKTFRLGDRVRIRVENASVELRQIDFSLSEPVRTVRRRRR